MRSLTAADTSSASFNTDRNGHPTYRVGSDGVVFISAGDVGTDAAGFINAALADPRVAEVRLEAGLFLVHEAIIVPSHKTLTGAGRDQTVIRAAEDFKINSPQVSGVVNSDWAAVGVTLSDFSIDANRVKPGGDRLQGCMMKQAVDFSIARVDVYNATGYAHMAQGDVNGRTIHASGSYEDCDTFNSQVHFEQMYCDGITLTDCNARDGDNDISTEAYFHPLAGSKNITFIDCSAIGNGFIGFSIASMVEPAENIRIIDCDIEINRPRSGFALTAIASLPTHGLEIINSRLVSDYYVGASIAGVTGSAQNSEIRGGVIGLEAGPMGSTPNAFTGHNSTAIGISSATSGAGVYGISNYGAASEIVWDGGTIEAVGNRGFMWAVAGEVTTSETTILSQSGFDVTRVELQGGAPAAIFDGVPINVPGGSGLAGGSLTFALQSDLGRDDHLSLNAAPTASDGISVDGSDVYFRGVLVGTASVDSYGRTITVELTAAASQDAVNAIAGAIIFVGDAAASAAIRNMPASMILTNPAGNFCETDLRLLISPPVLEGSAGPDWLLASDMGHTFNLQAGGNDVADGGRGNDLFNLGRELNINDQVHGGDGLDVIQIQGDYTGTRQLLLWGNITGVETIKLLSGYDARFGDLSGNSYSYDIRANDANVSAGQRFTVDGSSLRAGENLTFDGSLELDAQLKICGGAGSDRLTGGAGADFLDGGSGNDLLSGGRGNDIYYVDAGDIVSEARNAGLDAVYTRSSYTLAAGAEVEVLSTLDYRLTDPVVLRGNELNNAIYGNNGDNSLFGDAGSDSLRGLAGNDLLNGGLGQDNLLGGAGADTFQFSSVTESRRGALDLIWDFQPGIDILDLSLIDAVSATSANDPFQMADSFHRVAGELVIQQMPNGFNMYGDTDGDGAADFQITGLGSAPLVGDILF